jgi:hypothetical protein
VFQADCLKDQQNNRLMIKTFDEQDEKSVKNELDAESILPRPIGTGAHY